MIDKLHLEIAWRLRTDWHAIPLLLRVARFAAHAEGFRTGTLSITVVGRRAMATLHRRSLGLPDPTDVLAFDYGVNRRRGVLDGEIILCADVALQRVRAAQARRRIRLSRPGLLKTARAELALYLTHGLLHLAGYDDHAARDFQRMHRREDELLRKLGLGSPFEELEN